MEMFTMENWINTCNLKTKNLVELLLSVNVIMTKNKKQTWRGCRNPKFPVKVSVAFIFCCDISKCCLFCKKIMTKLGFYLTLLAVIVSTETPPCGPIGFRCLSQKSFQLCDPEDDTNASKREEDVYDCHDGTVCDDENPAYCSVPDELNIQCHNMKRGYRSFSNRDYDAPMDLEEFERAKDERLYGVPNEDSTTRPPKKDNMDYFDDDEEVEPSTTETAEYDVFTAQPEFDCEMFGFYPDNRDKSCFYYCDVKPDGVGFKLHHMKCGKGRVFDMFRKECILIGTTRNIRDGGQKSSFSCKHKRLGKYPDAENCKVFHVCKAKSRRYPSHHLTAECGVGTAFDPAELKCTEAAVARCHQPLCRTQKRFADAISCKVYYLCYADQVVRLRCPAHYRFDYKLLLCMPQQLAECRRRNDKLT
jgi:Chitin binding Peritrophin-A domain